MKYTTCLLLISILISCKSQNVEQKNNNEMKNYYYKEIKATHFIAPMFMSLEDDIIIELKNKGLILELVSVSQDPYKAKQKWNKYFYEDLPHHYSNSDALNVGARILKIENKDPIKIINNWPGVLTDQQYEQLYNEIKIEAVDQFELKESMKGKYIITPNQEFWDFTKESGYPLLADILSTYEREFEDYELVHENLDSALDYAVIIFDALCNQRDPDNSYYYNQITLDQFSSLPEELRVEFSNLGLTRYDGLPIYNMNYYSRNKKEEYSKIIKNQRENLEKSKRIFTNLPKPPFFINRVIN